MKPFVPFSRALVTWTPKSSFSPITPQGCIVILRHVGWFGISVEKCVGCRLQKPNILEFKEWISECGLSLCFPLLHINLAWCPQTMQTKRKKDHRRVNHALIHARYLDSRCYWAVMYKCSCDKICDFYLIAHSKFIRSHWFKPYCGQPKGHFKNINLILMDLTLAFIPNRQTNPSPINLLTEDVQNEIFVSLARHMTKISFVNNFSGKYF